MTHTPIDIEALEALEKANETYIRPFSGLNDPAYGLVRAVPELISALAFLRALLAEAREATWPFAEDASRIDARGVIMPHACASVGDYQRIARLHASIQSALRDASPTTE